MHEIELKARLVQPEQTELLLSRFADFAFCCRKSDQYWRLGGKTLRIRYEYKAGEEKVLITHKQKRYTGMIETNNELEFELASSSVPIFTAMLESIGFTLSAEKQKDTKIFIPHTDLFTAELLTDVQTLSAEFSVIKPIGTFLEIEVLYADEEDETLQSVHIRNAQLIFDTLLAALEIPQSAIETRPYNELLKSAL
ncbi:MAG: adenylate cyclase [Treponema sp.]|uniref:adenylate cyclase n=1 Tax=Treponema sp. TaxID=166 RepID=UPI003FA23E7D